MTGKTHIAISAASVTLFLLASGVRVSRSPLYLQALFQNDHGAVLLGTVPGADCTGLYGVAALFVLGVSAGLFPDLDVEGSSLERLPARAAAYLERHNAYQSRRQEAPYTAASRSLNRRRARAFPWWVDRRFRPCAASRTCAARVSDTALSGR